MFRTYDILALLAVLPEASAAEPTARIPRLNPDAPTTAFVIGLWYEAGPDGNRFVRGDRYSIAGVFTGSRPEAVERSIDLGGDFVIPPLGGAHNRNVDGPSTAPMASRYLKAGIFYCKNPNDVARVAAEGSGLLNKPGSLDAVFAQGGVSVRGVHPEGLYRFLARFNGMDPERLGGQAFFDVPTPEAVARRWPEVLKGRPDFLLEANTLEDFARVKAIKARVKQGVVLD